MRLPVLLWWNMLDKDMREPLFDFLDEKYGKVRTIEEKVIYGSRADVLAIIDGAIIGIEIKSDSDTYTRLATQIKDYEKYSDYCYLAVGESHRIHASEHVPKYWGIIVIAEDKVEILREAEPNPKVKLNYQLGLLWRPELQNIQLKHGFPKYRDKKRTEIYKFLEEKLGTEGLKRDMTEELFERDYTVYDAINSVLKPKTVIRKTISGVRVSKRKARKR